MRKKRQIFISLSRIIPVLLPLSGLWGAGCASEECDGNRSALPLAGFYSSGSDPGQISIDSINIYGIGAPGDSILLSSLGSQSEIYLPFRIAGGKTSYVIRYMQSEMRKYDLQDTITFTYTPLPKFVSSACGAMYDFEISRIDHTTLLIDSVVSNSKIIDNTPGENLRIYFRVAEK